MHTDEFLLDAADISKHYGAVVALKSASLRVKEGETHALMGANGAGKSTLVKVLTGAVRPDSGTITVKGQERTSHSPAQARRSGLVSVYQEPALIPELDVSSNLRLTRTPLEPFHQWMKELGLPNLNMSTVARSLPLATLRIIDLARALAIQPDVLMLDEMTAALPANLTDRVLEVVNNQRGGKGCIIFISHRMIEISSVCDRATVLREGETVGVVDVSADSADRIVDLMLGEIVGKTAERDADARTGQAPKRPRLEVRNLGSSSRLKDVSFSLHSGEVLGVVALEGQGQEDLFDILAGSKRAETGEILLNDKAVSFRHPADAIRNGLVYVPAERTQALLMQRPVRENIALPFSARLPKWGPIRRKNEKPKIDESISRLQIDTRAEKEVRLLSGGNQQKVTIARWVAGGVETMLCFDPTRGIDIRTKKQIYLLLRDLADAGAAILLYTSELSEIQAVCDRAIVIFGGEVVDELDAADADEATILRAAHNLAPESAIRGLSRDSTGDQDQATLTRDRDES